MSAAAPRVAPGPPGRLVLGHLPELRADAPGFFLRCFREYGDTVRLQWGGTPAFLFLHPDQVQEVLVARHASMGKQSRGYVRLREALGDGILTNDGALWRRQRRLMQPLFHARHLATLARIMEDACGRLIERLEVLATSGEVFDMSEEMMRFTFGVVGETLLGADMRDQVEGVAEAIPVALEHTVSRVYSPFPPPLWFPTPGNRRFHRAIRELRTITQDVIDTRRAAPTRDDDLLSLLIGARDEETGESFTDAELQDQVLTFFLAGHDTTSHALSWTFFLLSEHAAEARLLREEIDGVLGGRAPTHEDLEALPFLARVLDESMRLYPPAWLISRSATEDVEVGGVEVPEGAYVLVCANVTHRHPGFWENPEGFAPDRFLPERAKERHRFAYFPFGGGPRVCIGNTFAQIEARLCLASVLQRFVPELVPGTRVVPHTAITMKPRDGVPMTLRRR